MVQTGKEHRTPEASLVVAGLVSVRVAVSALHQPLLAFALLEQDPLPVVRAMLLSLHDDELLAAKKRYTAVRSAWNAVFLPLRFDQIFFVCAWHAIVGASQAMKQHAGLTIAVASAGPLQRRWLTTRPVWHAGELVAWCVEIALHAQDPRELLVVTLTEQNMLRLVSRDSESNLSD